MTDGSLPGTASYVSGTASFIPGLRPQQALSIPIADVLDLLRGRYGKAVDVALSPDALDVARPLDDLPPAVQSPRRHEADSSWMRRTNMVGVNVRTVGDYAGVVKYALTLPAANDSIHLLPVWEPGVVESLYGIASWNLNTRFFSPEWHQVTPQLDTVERQLRAVSNLLHVMGKTIGMDVIPHTDRFSEAAVGNPGLFEWMRVADRQIVDQSDGLADTVESSVFDWLQDRESTDAAQPVPPDTDSLFSLPEAERLAMLFGDPKDLHGRIRRRVDLIKHLKALGLEPVPATMGVPFREIRVDPDPTHTVVDKYGMSWPDYLITRPQLMSRVFSPLTRFKLYESKDDNAAWEIDFSKPRHHVWEYVFRHYSSTQHVGNFDFMRGDMSHVQMRPEGVPQTIDDYYDILRAVKVHIQQRTGRPWFGYFAESFLPARDVFQYGEELDHLEASLADATLGDLQSTVVGSDVYLRRFRRYLDDLATRACAPAYCTGTADKDDPRFDEFYRAGNEARLFTSLFLVDMPTYAGLGYEIRDVHDYPVENERYTKLFVFKEEGQDNVYPSKARIGDDFVWGENQELFDSVTRLRQFADVVLPEIGAARTRWLIPPDATGLRGISAWTQHPGTASPGSPQRLFVVNYDLQRPSGYFGIPGLGDNRLELEFSTLEGVSEADHVLEWNGFFHRVESVRPGEARVYVTIDT